MWELGNGYTLKIMDRESFSPHFLKHTKEFFDDTDQTFHLRELFTEEEKEKLRELGSQLGTPYILRLGVFKGEEFVGWHFGMQETASRFYMQNSGILPAHRKQGLYTKLLKRAIQIVTEKGFQEIYSRHMPMNNSVIIPKLKAGFVITSMQLDDVFGVLVHLTHYPHKTRDKVLAYRAGYVRADEEIKKYLHLP